MEKQGKAPMTACVVCSSMNINNFLNNIFPNDFIHFIETEKDIIYAKKLDKKKEKLQIKKIIL